MVDQQALRQLKDAYRAHIEAGRSPESFPGVVQRPIGDLKIVAKIGGIPKAKYGTGQRHYCAACDTKKKFKRGGMYAFDDGSLRQIGNDCEDDDDIRAQQLAANARYHAEEVREFLTRIRREVGTNFGALSGGLSHFVGSAAMNKVREIDKAVSALVHRKHPLARAIVDAISEGGRLRILVASTGTYQAAAAGTGAARGLSAGTMSELASFSVQGARALKAGGIARRLNAAADHLAKARTKFEETETTGFDEEGEIKAFGEAMKHLRLAAREVQTASAAIESARAFFHDTTIKSIVAFCRHPENRSLPAGKYFENNDGIVWLPDDADRSVILERVPYIRSLELPHLAAINGILAQWHKAGSDGLV